MFGKKKDVMEEAKARLRSDALRKKFAAMSENQLIMAMILRHDAAGEQALYAEYSELGSEAMSRCGYNPYEEN